MILPQTSSLVLTLMVMSLLLLGTWASMFKAAGKWRFELFYLDFAFGLLLTAVLCSFTAGDMGFDGFNFLDDLQHAGRRPLLFCFLAGAIFNLGNMLLMGAVAVAGMSVAFPIAVGVAIMLSAALGILVKAGGNQTMMLLGCVLIFTAVVVSAMAYRITAVQRHEHLARAGLAKSTRRPNPVKGIILAAAGGILMGSVGGMVARAREGDFGLGPYAAAAVFALGAFFSTFVYTIFFMNLPVEGEPLEVRAYFKSRLGQHIFGLLGGVLWFAGLEAGMVATAVSDTLQPSPLISLLLSQGSPVVAALVGIVILHELKGSDMRVKVLAVLMVILFATGLTMLALSPTYLPKT